MAVLRDGWQDALFWVGVVFLCIVPLTALVLGYIWLCHEIGSWAALIAATLAMLTILAGAARSLPKSQRARRRVIHARSPIPALGCTLRLLMPGHPERPVLTGRRPTPLIAADGGDPARAPAAHAPESAGGQDRAARRHPFFSAFRQTK